jgi:CelD/BcsL family acetyltransferase involved in cellulose biosynthesis
MFSSVTAVECISDLPSFLELREEWNALLEQTSVDSVFLRHEWYGCWWKAYGADKELSVVLIKEGDRLIGISPLMISKAYFRGFPVRKVGFIENKESPRSDFIVLQDTEKVIENTIGYLTKQKRRWNLLVLNNIPTDSETLEVVQAVCRKRNFGFLIRPSLNSPFLRVDADWETFYGKTTQRLKKRLRNNRNRIEKLGAVTVEDCAESGVDQLPLEDVFSVGWKSWKSEIGKCISCTPENRTFFSELGSSARAQGWLSLWILRVNGKSIAFEYHLKYKGVVHALRSEFDEEYSRYSPGSVLDSHIVRHVIENKFKEYDMGGSSDAYKSRWTPDVRRHCSILIFNKGIYGSLLKFIETRLVPLARKAREGPIRKAVMKGRD